MHPGLIAETTTDQVLAPDDLPTRSTGREWLLGHADALVVGVLIVIVAAVMIAARTDGHWWGDDWALYVRQADSIVHGGTRDVIADNEFTEAFSPGAEFTPPIYPWGFPLLLAPFVAVVGTDLDRLFFAELGSVCWFLAMWYVLAKRRIGRVLGVLGVGVLGLSAVHVRWSELIQSELPFMAVATTALVVLDRPRVRDALVNDEASLRPLVAVGVAGAAAFSVRREGLALVPAIAVAEVIAFTVWWRAKQPLINTSARFRPLLTRLAVAPVTLLAVVAGLQVVLPSTLVPGYRGTGPGNLLEFPSDHLGVVAQGIGLKDVGVDTPTVLGNAVLGWLAVATFVVLLVTGMVWAAVRRSAHDLPLIAFLGAVYFIGGSFRHPGERYMAMVGPIALIFAAMALRTLTTRLAGRNWGVAIAACVVAALVLANAVRSSELVRSARDFQRADAIEWGPDAPASVQMFDAVRQHTAEDAVVGFFKARAMTLRTDRRALQVGGSRPVEAVADLLTDVVLESGDTQQELVDASPDLYVPTWSNGRFTLYHLTKGF